MFNDTDAVELDLLGRLVFSAVSPGEVLHDLGFDKQAETAVEAIVECIIDHLDIALVFDVFQFIGWQAHYSRAFLPVEVHKEGF